MTENIKLFFEVLFLPGIIGVGVFSSLSDIKTGKVKNKLIKQGFLYGFLVYVFLFAWIILSRHYFYQIYLFTLRWNYFTDLSCNFIIALILGFVLWKLDIWAAADSKLFALFAFLIPLTVYEKERLPYFPSFALLVNIYIACLVYSVPALLLRLKKEKIEDLFPILSKEQRSGFFSRGRIFKSFETLTIYVAVFLIAFIISPGAKLSSVPKLLSIYVLAFAVRWFIQTSLKNQIKLRIILFSVILAYFAYLLVFPPAANFYSQAAIFVGIMLVLQLIFKLLNLVGLSDIRKIKIDDLKEKMVLGPGSLKIIEGDKKFRDGLDPFYFDGLSSDQVEKVRDFLKEKKIDDVEIYKTFPFAPFIFAGVVVTLLVRGPLISLFF